MTNKEINQKIKLNYSRLEDIMTPWIFTLNNEAKKILEENQKLQEQCEHEFVDGQCIYCYKEEI